jgi:hypothetical protein
MDYSVILLHIPDKAEGFDKAAGCEAVRFVVRCMLRIVVWTCDKFDSNLQDQTSKEEKRCREYRMKSVEGEGFD